MSAGQGIADAARRWIGTPYVHQASAFGAGADCLGLVRGVWREVCGAEPVAVPPYTPDWSEPQHDEVLWQAAGEFLKAVPCDAPKVGDVILFRMKNGAVAKHLGIVGCDGAEPTFIHAFSGHGVIESALSEPWRRRIVALFEFPDRSS